LLFGHVQFKHPAARPFQLLETACLPRRRPDGKPARTSASALARPIPEEHPVTSTALDGDACVAM
jgi:hypothetical protein